jgi:hypothetical protein
MSSDSCELLCLDLPQAEARAQRLVEFLQEVFETTYSFDPPGRTTGVTDALGNAASLDLSLLQISEPASVLRIIVIDNSK